MKKIALLLLAALLMTGLVACKKDEGKTSENEQHSIYSVEPTQMGAGKYTVCEGHTVQLKANYTHIFVYDESGETELQKLQMDSTVPERAKSELSVYDVNGDGTKDLFYLGFEDKEADRYQYVIYLYSAAKEEFVRCEGFTQLVSPHIDSDTHLITVNTPGAYGSYIEQQYTFSDYGIKTGTTLLRDGDKAALAYAATKGLKVDGATVEQGHYKLPDNKSISLFTVKAADGSFLCNFGLDMGAEHVYYSATEDGKMMLVE